MEHFPQLHFLFSRAPNLFHLLVLLGSPSADREILARSEEGVSLPGLPSVAQLGVRNAGPRAPSIWWGDIKQELFSYFLYEHPGLLPAFLLPLLLVQ